MNEKVKQYLDAQEKKLQQKEKLARAKILIEANLYDSYQGPHVEELFDPAFLGQRIHKTDQLQYVIEKATGQPLGIRYNYKDEEFEVLTPLEVTDEEYQQIKQYAIQSDKPILDFVLLIFAILFYVLSFVMFIFAFTEPDLTISLGFGLGSLGFGLILHGLTYLIKNTKK